MGLGAVLVENIYSRTQFPLHTFTATEEASGKPVERVGSARRTPTYFWTGNTVNLTQDLTAVMDRSRGIDMIAVDRVNNLGGKTLELHIASISDFSSAETIFSLTFPSVSAPGALDDTLGVRTEEGAWLLRFPIRYGRYVRTRVINAASYKPIIGGLMVGKSWTLPPINMPWSEDATEMITDQVESNLGAIGRTNVVARRRGTLNLKLSNLTDYDQARYHIGGHFAVNRPMWLVHDDAQAERAQMVLRDGDLSWRYESDWGYRQCNVGYVEHEPLAT